MPANRRYILAALGVIIPLVAAQGPPGGAGGDKGPPGDQGTLDPSKPPPGGPDNASPMQGDEGMAGYAVWYSNDYDCFINCMQVYNGVKTRERNATLDQSWISCVTESCDKKYAPQNLYQGMYIQEMFYKTGYIYECDGKLCDPATEPSPTGAGPGTGATDAEGPGVATGPGGDDHTASSAVSMSGLKTTVSTTACSTVTASEPAATATGSANGAGKVDWNMGMGVAAAMAWGAIAIL